MKRALLEGLVLAGLLLSGVAGAPAAPATQRTVADWRAMSKARFYAEFAGAASSAGPLADVEQLAGARAAFPHAEYVPPSYALDADNDGRVTQADADLVASRGRLSLTDPSYDARADVLANAFATDARGYPVASIPQAAVDAAVTTITAGPVHQARRPLIGAAFYAWYHNPEGIALPESWSPAVSVPLPGLYGLFVPYDSTRVLEMQRDLAHVAGIDFFFVSDFDRQRFLGPATELARKDPGKYAFMFLYEHVDRLPLRIIDDRPRHDFDDPAVRAAFWSQMEEDLDIIRQIGPENYVTLHGYYPVWVWAGNVFVGEFAGAIEEFNAAHDMKIALLGSEISLFPPESGLSEEQRQRLRAYIGLMPYGYYTPLHAVNVGKGELNEAYASAVFSSAALWWKNTRSIDTIYGTPLEMGVSIQLGFADKRGDPPLRSSRAQRDEFIAQLYAQIVTAIEPPVINVTSWNEWGEGHQVEPSVEDGFFDLGLVKRYFGPSYYYRSHPDRIGPVVIARQ